VTTQGLSASFSVGASGTAPLSYQWRFNNANLSGQNASSLTFNPVSTNNAGNYSVVVSNSGGSVTSSVVTLTVSAPVAHPLIATQPASQTVQQGQSVTLSVGASGSAPLSYQWRFNNANLSGKTASSLTFNPVSTNNAGNYDVIVSNSAGSVTSLVATLTVTLPTVAPAITTQPSAQSVVLGQTATFNVVATGTAPLTYFWRKGTTVVSTSASSSFSISNAQTNDAGSYSVIVSNSAGTITSSGAALTVNVPAFIKSSPANRTVALNSSTTFTVVAGGTGPFGYQWYFNSAPVAGQTGSSYTIASVQAVDLGSYYAVVTNAYGSATSSVATLAEIPAPATAPLTVQIVGSGSVSPNYNGQLLVVGSNYTVTATADASNVFVGWSGGAASNNRTLTFTMQSNLVLIATFQATPPAPGGPTFTNGTYNGLFYPESGVTTASSGYITVGTTANGKYSGKLLLAGKSYSIRGQFDAEGRATNSIARGASARLVVELTLSPEDSDVLNGRVTDGNWSSEITADRCVFNAGNRAAQAGSYTLAIPGTPGTITSPVGAGYASITINAFGRVQIKGVLADGTKIMQNTTLSKNSEVPLYVSLSRGIGSLIGWLHFSSDDEGDIHGTVNWAKAQQPSNWLYPAGFAVQSEVIGSAYSMPTGGTRVLNMTNGVLTLGGGYLTNAISDQIVLGTNNKITVSTGSPATFNLTPATGLFKGTIVNPA
ncbi:MAG TPA: immunoglobulin domain-containing protein, partial [Candidatus Paceibacterota bacterium]|nr:immunoglobulin domain-containing protein [Candidatus Paceibacterota bacterium]